MALGPRSDDSVLTGNYGLSPQQVVKMLVPVMPVSGAAVLILVVLMKGSASLRR
jgi:hypothetical protein